MQYAVCSMQYAVCSMQWRTRDFSVEGSMQEGTVSVVGKGGYINGNKLHDYMF